MNEQTRAFVEVRKTLVELQITMLNHAANVKALEATVLELGGEIAATVLQKRLKQEFDKQLAALDSYRADVEILQTILDKSASPTNPLH